MEDIQNLLFINLLNTLGIKLFEFRKMIKNVIWNSRANSFTS